MTGAAQAQFGETIIDADDLGATALFGSAVACRDDWVLVGASEKTFSSVFDVSGAVYAFRRNATAPLWNTTETAKIRPAIGPIGERFGESLDMSLNRAIIGAPRGGAFAGSTGNAYIDEETGGVWNPIDSLDPGEAAGGFGKSVSIWGSHAVVGSPLDESDTSGLSNVGAAFVFERSGSTWNLVAKLVAPEEQTNLQFGHDVSIDDRRITVGTLSNTSERAYVFSRRDLGSGGEWFLSARLYASDGMTGDDYGRVVAMDGDHIAVGARLADPSAGSTNGGKAYFYRYPSAFASFCFAD